MWFLPSMALTVGLAFLGWWGIACLAEMATEALLSNWEVTSSEAWLHVLTEWLIWAFLLVLKIKFTKYIVLIVMGPLFGALSQAVESEVTGAHVQFSWAQLIRDGIRGLRSALLLATFEFGLAFVLWAAGLTIPALSPVVLPASWLLGAWAYGAASMDYVWERDGKGAREGLRASLKRPGLALGIGIPFALWMAFPVLAWTVGPMMGGMGAAAAASVALKSDQVNSQ